MYIIIFEYQVTDPNQTAFEKMYHSDGDWTKLFQRSPHYLGTELFKQGSNSYITIDRWENQTEYDAFLSTHSAAYNSLDNAGEELTSSERLIGKYYSIGS